MEVKSYICPSCGSVMQFDVVEQKMVCMHCGTKMGVHEVEQNYENVNHSSDHVNHPVENVGFTDGMNNMNPMGAMNHGMNSMDAADNTWDGADNAWNGADNAWNGTDNAWNGTDDGGLERATFKVYRCGGCGAEVLTDDYTAATFCSFCGRPSLMEDRLSGALMPEYVIPFKIKKDDAVEVYKKWVKKGKLTPSLLKSQATIDKITGMYVPFWLYDYDTQIYINAKCTRVRRRVSGNYEITDTDHFAVTRDMEAEFDRIPADASEKMPDDMMDKLEPFMYREMVKFEMPYLSGYYSERYNYNSQEMQPRVEKRVRSYIEQTGMETITSKHYSSVNVLQKNIQMRNLRASYALLPVWILNYSYNGISGMFTLNGQTGKIVADRPVSKKKAAGWFTGITMVTFTILMLLGRFLGK